MKRIVVAGGLVALAAILGFLYLSGKEKTAAGSISSVDPVAIQNPPSTVVSDPTEIFQKAFWRHPTPEDRILHAERREWVEEGSASGSLKKWQWFVVVEASPGLVKYLREENAFGLIQAEALTKVRNAPAWFTPPANGADFFRAPSGELQLIFSSSDHLLYAMDSGGGFQPGLPEALPQKALPPSSNGGRLPPTSPPRPRDDEPDK